MARKKNLTTISTDDLMAELSRRIVRDQSMANEKKGAYIGRNSEAKVAAVTVDMADAETAEWVAGMIRDGLDR